MSGAASRAYVGHVVHKRLRPRRHGFRYRVFCLNLDVDEIDALDARLRLFSRNRRNLLSFHDADFGCRDGTPVATHARRVLTDAGLAHAGHRIALLCYPRLFGYVFNPLSVYFCHDASGRLAAVIYEVSNTFGERRSYVIPASPEGHLLHAQRCSKEMYVSPFTDAEGTYDFHIAPPREEVVVGVALRGPDGPSLKTHFRGRQMSLSDGSILRLVARHPLMTFKVITAIHFEALRLWLKRVPVFAHTRSPAFAVSIVKPSNPDVPHVQ